MNIYEEIRSKLTEEWKGGATQQEIADRAGVTNQHINNLISGKRSVESMKLETLFKLFPQAEINLSGAQLAGDHAAQTQVGQTNLMGQIKDNMFSGFANLNNAVTQSAYQNQLGQRDLQAQIADCCCKTQSGMAAVNNNITQQFCQLNYNNAMQACEIKQAIAAEGAATRQLIQTQYIAEVERKLAEAKQQLFVLNKFGQYANNGNCGCCNTGCGCGSC